MLKTHFTPTLLLITFLASSAPGAVNIKREAAVVEYKTFDRANPPAEMPHLYDGEEAITESSFLCQTNTHCALLNQKKSDDGVTAVVSVRGVTVTLGLHLTVWLPKDATDKLKAHEEGHRKIAEKIYLQRAEKAARAAATPLTGRHLTGEGADLKTAAQNAAQPTMREVGETYLAETAAVSDVVNNTYDALTAHGTTPKPVEDAITESFDRYEKEHPATRPATRSASRKPDKK